MFLFRFGGFSETAAAHVRLMNTVVGGGLALLMDALWKSVDVQRVGRAVRQRESVQ